MEGRFRKGWMVVVAAGLLITGCGGGVTGGGGPVLPGPKEAPEIFETYHADRNSTMAGGWVAGMDMSGVAFDQVKTATLITRRHVVMAKHFSRGAAEAVIFHDRGGRRLERKLIGFAPAAGDVMVGLLDEPVPAGYRSYALPAIGGDAAALIGRPVIVSDQKRRLFIHEIERVGGGGIGFRPDMNEKHGWAKNLVVGDSGNPSFVIAGGELVLVETHTTGGSGAGPYYGDAVVQASVKAAVAKLDPAYSIRTVVVR